MIHFVQGSDLWMYSGLASEMFRERAKQFRDRLKWELDVDKYGYEKDDYDNLNPAYVIVQAQDGGHLGSLRLLPTAGKTMIDDHFSHALADRSLFGGNAWECTRFCVTPGSSTETSFLLLAGAGLIMREFGVEHLLAVFDQKMLRRYSLLKVTPQVIGSCKSKEGTVFAGRWEFDTDSLKYLIMRAKVDAEELELALVNSPLFGRKVTHLRSLNSCNTSENYTLRFN